MQDVHNADKHMHNSASRGMQELQFSANFTKWSLCKVTPSEGLGRAECSSVSNQVMRRQQTHPVVGNFSHVGP